MNEIDDPSNRKPTIGGSLLLLAGAFVFMTVFFGLCALLKISLPAFGLLFLVYWAAMLRQDLGAYFPALLGGLTGILLAWILLGISPTLGIASLPVSLMIIGTLLFCFIRGHVPLIANNSTMLFLTAATISQLDVTHNAPAMAASLLLGAVYMGGTAVLVRWIALRRAGRTASPA